MTLYQLAFMKKAPYHVVKEAVEFAKSIKDERAGNFVNAVLRGFLRDRDSLTFPADPIERTSIEHSFPAWMARRWLARFGEAATVKLLETMNRSPCFSLRIRRNDMSAGEVGERLREDGIASSPGRYLTGALSVARVSRVLNHELFHAGLLTIQDEASQLSVRALNPQAGDRILDACAGLGTKTVQLGDEHPDVTLISMDVEQSKLRRLAVPASRIVGDARRSPFRDDAFDGALVDAPCTSLGIIGKHPEIKWRRNEEDIQKFARLQLGILKGLWPAVRTGGVVVYSVCSFEPEETTGVINDLAKEVRFALENPLPFLFNKEYFLSLPHETGMDGFFIARLRKR
jgi:16S rRNA (cytosine967-C5)-methyltransferase